MLDTLIALDKAVVVAVNGTHIVWLDYVMIFISGKLSWIPLYAAILYGIIKKHHWKISAILIAAILLNFGLTDQISLMMKFGFERLRPCHDSEIGDLLHMVVGCGGQFGFVSSHASNTMGLAIITALIFRKHWVTTAMLAFALLNSYSRIYLGKHYLGDVSGGIILGILCALVSYTIAQFVLQRINLKK